jgi:hypothetical protein
MHGGKDWAGIAALAPGRKKKQCNYRRRDALIPSIALTAGRTGKWTPDEDDKLKDSVQMHGEKDRAAIAALVPGRTRTRCRKRWHAVSDCSINQAKRRMRYKHTVTRIGSQLPGWSRFERKQ